MTVPKLGALRVIDVQMIMRLYQKINKCFRIILLYTVVYLTNIKLG